MSFDLQPQVQTMIKTTIQHFKFLLLFLADLIFRICKVLKYIYFSRHEVERICESQSDIYEKSMRIDDWLRRTKCEPIQIFLNKHFDAQSDSGRPSKAISRILLYYQRDEPDKATERPTKRRKRHQVIPRDKRLNDFEEADITLSNVLQTLTEDLYKIIVRAKNLDRLSAGARDCLKDVLFRILSYKITIMFAERLARTKYDAGIETHTAGLMKFWNNLIESDQRPICDSLERVFPDELSSEVNDRNDIVSNRWSHVGFQGEDPGTDFRGMGLLGLSQLEYLSSKPKYLAIDLLKRSLQDEPRNYPFAIVGINLTYNLLKLFRDGSMKNLYYDTGDVLFRNQESTLKMLTTFNDLYVELFLRFDCFWQEAKPETILEFGPLMEKFIDIVKIDLRNRNFSLKFIY